MRRMKVSAYSGPLFLSIFLLASTALHAQGPDVGTSVSVKMIDTVNSGSDPAGKQYRASVTKAVTATNGIAIPQGANATVTLTTSGSDYAAQLSSITINGQQVAVTSNSATVSAVAQYAQAKAASAVSSVLGGYGHHVSAPAAVAAAATGQHVSLPTGTTLTFVLGQPPASSAIPPAAAAAQPPAAQPMEASAAPAPSPAASSAPIPAASSTAGADGRLTVLNVCFSTVFTVPTDPTQKTAYLSAVFETDADHYSAVAPAFSDFLRGISTSKSANCMELWAIRDAQQMQQQFINDPTDPATAKRKFVQTGWRYGQPALGRGQNGFDPLGHGSDGLDLSQHRMTTYFCVGTAPGSSKFVSPVFQADWNSDVVSKAWETYLRSHYGQSVNSTDRCTATSPSLQVGFHQNALQGPGIVAVDWKYTPGAATAINAAPAPSSATASAPATANTAYYKECAALFGDRANEHCAAAANEYYVYCSGGSPDSTGPRYFSDVFAYNKNYSSHDLSADLAPSFLLFLETKYGVKASSDFYPTNRYTGGAYPTACSSSLTPLSWAQQQKQTAEANAVASLHKQIVETGWKTAIAPLPPVTRPPAAANEYYVFCYSDKALLVQYFSEIFAAVPPAGDSIANAFFASLQKKYSFNDPRPGPPVTCDVSPKAANAYMFQTEWSVRQNMENTGDEGKKAIETGWKYTP